jgi:hypothetical protein
MQLDEVTPYRGPATDTVMMALGDESGFVGQPGFFYRQLGEHLKIDTRLLADAVNRLFRAGKLTKLYGGARYRYVVGICLPRYHFRRDEVSHLADGYQYGRRG